MKKTAILLGCLIALTAAAETITVAAHNQSSYSRNIYQGTATDSLVVTNASLRKIYIRRVEVDGSAEVTTEVSVTRPEITPLYYSGDVDNLVLYFTLDEAIPVGRGDVLTVSRAGSFDYLIDLQK